MNKKTLLSLLLFGLLVLAIPLGVKLAQQRQIFFSRAGYQKCGELLFQYNECIGCNKSHPVYKDDCDNWSTGGEQDDSGCSSWCEVTECGDPIFQYRECFACNKSRGAYKDDCGNWATRDEQDDSGCSSWCSTSTPTSAPTPPSGGGNYCTAAGYFECTPGIQNGTCIKDGKTCTNWTRYKCNFGGKNYCDNNCTEPCSSGISPTTRPGTIPSPTIPSGSTTTCLGPRTWADIYDGLQRADYPGPWEPPSVVLSAFNRTSCPTCTNADVTRFLSPPLAEGCLTCIKNQNSGLPNSIRTQNPDLFRGCTETELLTYWCNGGISAQATGLCNSAKNGVCATSCGGTSPTPTGKTAFYRISKTPFADETSGWQSYTSEPMVVSLEFPGASAGQDLTVFAQFKSSTGETSSLFTKTITYRPAAQITSISCGYSPTGVGTEVRINGENFGDRGSGSRVLINGQSAQITSWSNQAVPTETPVSTPTSIPQITPSATPVQNRGIPLPYDSTSSGILGVSSTQSMVTAKIRDRLEGGVLIPIQLITHDGQSLSTTCTINLTTVAFIARTGCRPAGNLSINNVRVQIYESVSGAKPLFDQKIALSNEGQPIWTPPPQLEVGKKYVLVAKGPHSLGHKVEFIASEGTTVLDVFNLLVGDIAPINALDNLINTLDFGELKREWTTTIDVTRAGDFNLDQRVNSVDYSCLVQNFNKNGEKFLSGQ